MRRFDANRVSAEDECRSCSIIPKANDLWAYWRYDRRLPLWFVLCRTKWTGYQSFEINAHLKMSSGWPQQRVDHQQPCRLRLISPTYGHRVCDNALGQKSRIPTTGYMPWPGLLSL